MEDKLRRVAACREHGALMGHDYDEMLRLLRHCSGESEVRD
jgi:hypothetical protein